MKSAIPATAPTTTPAIVPDDGREVDSGVPVANVDGPLEVIAGELDDSDLVAVAAARSMVRNAVVAPGMVKMMALELVQQASGASASQS